MTGYSSSDLITLIARNNWLKLYFDYRRPSIKLDMSYNLVYYQTMIRLNIHQAKTHLSRYLEKLLPGERIILCKRNVARWEIRMLDQRPENKRPIGLAQGNFQVPDSFFEPLPEEYVELFEGGPSQQ